MPKKLTFEQHCAAGLARYPDTYCANAERTTYGPGKHVYRTTYSPYRRDKTGQRFRHVVRKCQLCGHVSKSTEWPDLLADVFSLPARRKDTEA